LGGLGIELRKSRDRLNNNNRWYSREGSGKLPPSAKKPSRWGPGGRKRRGGTKYEYGSK